jgi:hypothetical protein
MDAPANPAAPAFRQIVTRAFDLAEPILRESGEIARLTLRKPKAGEMRGLTVQALVNGDINEVIALLPRICDPFITDAETDNMAVEDIAEAAGIIYNFFISPQAKAKIERATGMTLT